MAWTLFRRRTRDAHVRPPEKKDGYGFVALHAHGEASWTRRDYAGLARAGYMRNPVVYRCVRLVAEAAASVPLLAYDGDAEQKAHPLLDLLARPNPRQSQAAFLEALTGHLLLAGNAYAEFVPLPSGAAELHLLRPDRVKLKTDETGWPVGVEAANGASRRTIALADAKAGAGAAPSALHMALFHPLDDHYGLSALEAALMALDIHNAATTWNKALLDNSARPSGALVYQPKDGNNLPDDQFDRLKRELEESYSGAKRAGRPMILDGGLDWKAMGLTPKDMDFIEAKNAASRDIALAFGVPPMLLGIPGDNTYANYREANRAFHRQTVLPLARRIAGELSAWLAPAFGEALRLEPDADQVDALSSDREALWARLGAATFLSDDEKRAAVGYGPRAAAGEAQ